MRTKECFPALSARGSPRCSAVEAEDRLAARRSDAGSAGGRELQPRLGRQARDGAPCPALTAFSETRAEPSTGRSPRPERARPWAAAGRAGRLRGAGSRRCGPAQLTGRIAGAPLAARPAPLAQPLERGEAPAARPGSASSPGGTRAQRPAGNGDAVAAHPETLLPVRLDFCVQLLQGGGEAAEEQILPHQLVRALRCRRHGGPAAPPAPPAHGRGWPGPARPGSAPGELQLPACLASPPLLGATPHPAGASSPRFSRLLIGRRRAPAACWLAARHVRLVLLGAGGRGAAAGGVRAARIDWWRDWWRDWWSDRATEPSLRLRRGPSRASPGRPVPPGLRRNSRGGTLTSRLCLRSVARQGALIQRKAGKGFPGGRLRLCQAGEAAAAGLAGPGSGPLVQECIWYLVLPTPMCHSVLGKNINVVKKSVI